MSEIVVLDAVGVAMIARAARDLQVGVLAEPGVTIAILPDPVAEALRATLKAGGELPASCHDALIRYADQLDEIAETALTLDQHEHEIEHQLRWWTDRVGQLESRLTRHATDNLGIGRELALFRGRISGAQAMRRHYAQQRVALIERHARADADCAAELTTI